MVRALGLEKRQDLLVFLAIAALVAISPLGKEATAAPILVAYRLLLIAITLGSLSVLRHKTEPEVCPIFIGLCGTAVILMLISVVWNPGSTFDGFYRWYQYLLFGSAFIAMALIHRDRSTVWKQAILWTVVGIDLIYLIVCLIVGQRPLLATFVNPNYFASYLLAGFSVSVAIALFGRNRIAQTAGAASAAFLYYGMTQAWSRGATLAALGVAAMAILRFGRERAISRKLIAAVVGIGIIGATAASPALVRKFLDRGQLDPYNYQRPRIWWSALQVIAEHPFLGVGLGEFFHISKRFSPPTEGTIARYLKRPAIAHSEYLQLAAESGIPAAILMFGLAVYLFRIALRRARRCHPEQRLFQEAAILTACGLGFHALVDNNWTVPVMATGLVVFSVGDVLPQREWRWPARWSPRLRLAGAVLLVLLVADAVVIPGLAVYFNEAGAAAYNRRDDVRAESYYRLAAAIVPYHDVFLDNAGTVYLDKFIETGDSRWLDYAQTLFSEGWAANPNAEEPGRRLESALLQRLTGNREKDLPVHSQIAQVDRGILGIDPFDPFVRKNLAEALYNTGNRTAATQELARAIDFEPNYVPAYLQMAKWLKEGGDDVKAEEYLQKAIEIVNRFRNVALTERYEALLLGRPEPETGKP
jgi:O-antigen ligase